MIKIMSVLVTTCWSRFWSKFGIDGKCMVNLNMPHYQSFNMCIICLSVHSLFNCTVHQQFDFTIPSHSIKTNLLLWPFPHYGRRIWIECIGSWIFNFGLWNRKCTNLLSFQVAQSSPTTLSFLTLNSFPINKILLLKETKQNNFILYLCCKSPVQEIFSAASWSHYWLAFSQLSPCSEYWQFI